MDEWTVTAGLDRMIESGSKREIETKAKMLERTRESRGDEVKSWKMLWASESVEKSLTPTVPWSLGSWWPGGRREMRQRIGQGQSKGLRLTVVDWLPTLIGTAGASIGQARASRGRIRYEVGNW